MKLKELIEKTRYAQGNQSWVDIEQLINAVGLQMYIYDDSENIKCHYVMKWLCTDTWVGLQAYYLNDELIATSFQSARRASEKFSWVSEEAFNKVVNYFLSLYEKDSPSTFTNLDEEMGDGFELEYSSQILGNHVIYNNEKCYINKKYHDFSDIKKWKTVDIKYNNKNINVNMDEVKIPYE